MTPPRNSSSKRPRTAAPGAPGPRRTGAAPPSPPAKRAARSKTTGANPTRSRDNSVPTGRAGTGSRRTNRNTGQVPQEERERSVAAIQGTEGSSGGSRGASSRSRTAPPVGRQQTRQAAGEAPEAHTSRLNLGDLPDATAEIDREQTSGTARSRPRRGFRRSTIAIGLGAASLVIFFGTQPKHHPPATVPPPGGGTGTQPGGGGSGGSGGSGGGGGGGPVVQNGPPALPSPTAAHTLAWQSKQQIQGLNTFDIGPTAPFQENALQGFLISDQNAQSVEALTINGNARMAQWSGTGAPTFNACINALQGGSPHDIPVEKSGTWSCVQTPEGLIARLQSHGFASDSATSVTLKFAVTVWNPNKE